MAQNNLELMRTLDDSWNAQDWETFEKRHSRDTAVFWPGQAEPTRGRDNHKAESIEFFKTFPDNHLINHPYKVEIAQGEWTCTVADFTGTMRGSMKGPGGQTDPPDQRPTRSFISSSAPSHTGRTARSWKRNSFMIWSDC